MLKRKKYKVFPVLLSNKGNNTEHVWLSGPLELNDNDDVQIIDPEDGQTLVYDGDNNVWVNDNGAMGVAGWINESHTFGEDPGNGDYIQNKKYFGGGQHSSGIYPNWNTPHWDYEIDPTNWVWDEESFAGRKFPTPGITGLKFNGQVSVPHFHSIRITVYWGRCLSNNAQIFTLPPQQLTCLGEYETQQSTGVNLDDKPFLACFQFKLGDPFTTNTGEYLLDEHSKLFFAVEVRSGNGTGNAYVPIKDYSLYFEISSSLVTNGDIFDPPLGDECSSPNPPPPPANL